MSKGGGAQWGWAAEEEQRKEGGTRVADARDQLLLAAALLGMTGSGWSTEMQSLIGRVCVARKRCRHIP